jgi:hypothetical protein
MKCSTKCEPEFSNRAAAFDRLLPGKRRQKLAGNAARKLATRQVRCTSGGARSEELEPSFLLLTGEFKICPDRNSFGGKA